MSILIKDMEMPKNCAECPIADIGAEFYYCEKIELKSETRPCDCPLVEVPTPHGRLIDADRLDCLSWYDTGGCFEDGVLWVANKIDELPTIIETEGSEE